MQCNRENLKCSCSYYANTFQYFHLSLLRVRNTHKPLSEVRLDFTGLQKVGTKGDLRVLTMTLDMQRESI